MHRNDDGVLVLNIREKGIAIRALMRLKSLGPVDDTVGICANMRKRSRSKDFLFYHFVREFSKGWKHHTGSPSFPIPVRYGDDGMWFGEAGRLRYDLIDYMIKKVEEAE